MNTSLLGKEISVAQFTHSSSKSSESIFKVLFRFGINSAADVEVNKKKWTNLFYFIKFFTKWLRLGEYFTERLCFGLWSRLKYLILITGAVPTVELQPCCKFRPKSLNRTLTKHPTRYWCYHLDISYFAVKLCWKFWPHSKWQMANLWKQFTLPCFQSKVPWLTYLLWMWCFSIEKRRNFEIILFFLLF